MTDGRTDRRTDGGDCNIPNAFLKKCGDKNQYVTSQHIQLYNPVALWKSSLV